MKHLITKAGHSTQDPGGSHNDDTLPRKAGDLNELARALLMEVETTGTVPDNTDIHRAQALLLLPVENSENTSAI